MSDWKLDEVDVLIAEVLAGTPIRVENNKIIARDTLRKVAEKAIEYERTSHPVEVA